MGSDPTSANGTAQDAEAVARQLDQPRRTGKHSWMACCPAHDDKTPSLSLTDKQNGKLTWHCFAGCSQDAVREALLAHGIFTTREAMRQRSVIGAQKRNAANPNRPTWRFAPRSVNQFAAKDVDYWIPGLILKEGITLLAGESGTLKSTLLHCLMFGVAEWNPGIRILWIGLEEQPAFNRRELALGQDLDDYSIMTVKAADDGRLPAGYLREVLSDYRETYGRSPDIVVLDPIRDVIAASDMMEVGNSNSRVRQELTRIQQFYAGAVVGITHFTKSRGPLATRILGAQDWFAVPRSVLCTARFRGNVIRFGRLKNSFGSLDGVWEVELRPRVDVRELGDESKTLGDVMLARLGPCDRSTRLQDAYDADQSQGGDAGNRHADLRAFVVEAGGEITKQELDDWFAGWGITGKETMAKYRAELVRKMAGNPRRTTYRLKGSDGTPK